MYSYCLNNPGNYADSGGELSNFAVGAAVGIAVYAIVVIANKVIASKNKDYNEGNSTDEIVHNQDDVDMKYGLTTIADNGCGIVATHNAIILAGGTSNLAEVTQYFDTREILFGGVAVAFWTISGYLRSKGYDVHTNLFTSNMDDLIKNSSNNTAVVSYGYGLFQGHYMAVKWDGSRFLLYNNDNKTTYQSVDSIDEYLNKFDYSSLSIACF